MKYTELSNEDSVLPLEMDTPFAAPNTKARRWNWPRIYAVGLYSLATILLYADQNLLAPNLTQVANEFGLTPEQRDRKLGGDLALAFFVLGAPASLIIGCWADRTDRTVLFGLTVGLGESACLATYFITSYNQLYICRAITGLSMGGALPLIYSVLGDWFKAEERHAVSAIVGIGTGIGISVGQGIAGFLGPTFGWRIPFLVVSIPALICAVLVFFTVQEPERGVMERAILEGKTDNSSSTTHMSMQENGDDTNVHVNSVYDKAQGPRANSHWQTFKQLMRTPTVILSLLQGAPGCVPWGIVNTFLNDFLSEDRGMTVEGATLTVLSFGIGTFFGLLLGGAAGHHLYTISPKYPPVFAGAMAIFGCFPFWALLNLVNSDSSIIFIAAITVLAGIGAGATGPIVKATLQNVSLPRARGQAFALFNTFDDFGRGLGPLFVAALISNMGRTQAFNVGVIGWVFCGLFNMVMYCFVHNDERKVQAILASGLDDSVDS